MPGEIDRGITLRCCKCGRSRLQDLEFPSQGLAVISKLAHLQKIGVPLGWKFESYGTEAGGVCPLCQSIAYSAHHKCSKCGHGKIDTEYCSGSEVDVDGKKTMTCRMGLGGEHQHRTCGRCKYVWVERCLGEPQSK
jgi:hypothetical protein